MLRTLVLLRIRWGCFDTEVEDEGGIADSVWTFKPFKQLHQQIHFKTFEIHFAG